MIDCMYMIYAYATTILYMIFILEGVKVDTRLLHFLIPWKNLKFELVIVKDKIPRGKLT